MAVGVLVPIAIRASTAETRGPIAICNQNDGSGWFVLHCVLRPLP